MQNLHKHILHTNMKVCTHLQKTNKQKTKQTQKIYDSWR